FRAAASIGVSCRPISSAPSTPRVIAPTPVNITAAIATPPTTATGIVLRESLTSPAMIAIRMKPSQVQKKIAAATATPRGPLSPKTGERWRTSTACIEAAPYRTSRPTSTARNQMSTPEVSRIPNRFRQVIASTPRGRNDVRRKTWDHLPEVGREGERDDARRDQVLAEI